MCWIRFGVCCWDTFVGYVDTDRETCLEDVFDRYCLVGYVSGDVFGMWLGKRCWGVFCVGYLLGDLLGGLPWAWFGHTCLGCLSWETVWGRLYGVTSVGVVVCCTCC